MHVLSKMIGSHQDAMALLACTDPRIRAEIHRIRSQPMVMLYSLWEDAELWLGQYAPYWQLPVPKGWMLFFTPTLWHAVWRLLDHKSTRGSITCRGYLPTRVWLGGDYVMGLLGLCCVWVRACVKEM